MTYPASVQCLQSWSLAGMVFGDLIDPASRVEAETRLKEGKAGPFEVRLAQDASRIAHLYLYRAEGRLVAYMIDVSEQKQMELQLAQSQKMQAIGQLAGGVAHDFNNLLTAIQLRLDELLHRHPVGDPSYEGLNEIRQTGVRAADLVRKLLAFSRKQTVQREVLDLGELISEFEVLLRWDAALAGDDVSDNLKVALVQKGVGNDPPRTHLVLCAPPYVAAPVGGVGWRGCSPSGVAAPTGCSVSP